MGNLVGLRTRYSYLRPYINEIRPSYKFDNPYLMTSWVTNDKSVILCALVSGTCFWVLGNLLYLYDYCLYITYNCFFCHSFNFLIILQKCKPSVILFSSSYNLNDVFLLFCTTIKGLRFNNCFSQKI